MRHVDARRRMAALLAQWRRSTETQAVFAARHGISRTKLRYWVRRDGATRTPDPGVAFAPVAVIGAPTSEASELEVVLADGSRVLVRPGASPELLRTVLTTLRSPC